MDLGSKKPLAYDFFPFLKGPLFTHADKLVAHCMHIIGTSDSEQKESLWLPLGDLCNTLANCCEDMSKIQEKLSYAEIVLMLTQRFYGKIHANIASGLNNLGNAYTRIGE